MASFKKSSKQDKPLMRSDIERAKEVDEEYKKMYGRYREKTSEPPEE